MTDMNKRQRQCVVALSVVLDRCHRNGLVLNVMDGEVYLGTQNRMDENGCLVQEDQYPVRTNIEADGGGW
ncbi:hypothetical protein LCGC14_2641200 [marine sediment metagenome]|uniref:Uncharacterized protein n=1 Tax=marine sediment metagenome TaxID=412755 RepID=A0A0F8ZXK7_9ZZZZ